MTSPSVSSVTQRSIVCDGDLVQRFVRVLLHPASASILATAVLDLLRSKADLIAENPLLHHQLALLKRQTKRPKLNPSDRLHVLIILRISREYGVRFHDRTAGDAAALASQGVSAVLEVEEPTTWAASADARSDNRVDPAHSSREPLKGLFDLVCRRWYNRQMPPKRYDSSVLDRHV